MSDNKEVVVTKEVKPKAVVKAKDEKKETKTKVPLEVTESAALDEEYAFETIHPVNEFNIKGKSVELKPLSPNFYEKLNGQFYPSMMREAIAKYKECSYADGEKTIVFEHVIIKGVLFVLASSTFNAKNFFRPTDCSYLDESTNINKQFEKIVILITSNVNANHWVIDSGYTVILHNTGISAPNGLIISRNISMTDSAIDGGRVMLKNIYAENVRTANPGFPVIIENVALKDITIRCKDSISFTSKNDSAIYRFSITAKIKKLNIWGDIGRVVIAPPFCTKGTFNNPPCYDNGTINIVSKTRLENGYFSGRSPIPFIGTENGIYAGGNEFKYDSFKLFYTELCNKMGISGIVAERVNGLGFLPPHKFGQSTHTEFSNKENDEIYAILNELIQLDPLIPSMKQPDTEFNPDLKLTNSLVFTLATQIYSRLSTIKELKNISDIL